MKYHGKCKYCDRKFTNATPGLVKACIANHTKGSHPEKIKGPSTYSLDRKKPILAIEDAPKPEPTKRPYSHRAKPSVAVCFCPKCGCNIRAVQVAMGL